MRSVSFWVKFTSGSRICASRIELLKVPIGGSVRNQIRLQEILSRVERISFQLLLVSDFHRQLVGIWNLLAAVAILLLMLRVIHLLQAG